MTYTAEQIMEKVTAAGLLEYGVDRTPVADKWNLVNEERAFQSNPIRVVAGLNNADTDKALLALLKQNPDKVLEGMAIANAVVNAEEMYLYIPDGEDALAEELADKTAAAGVQIQRGIVNVRESRGGAFHHFETLIALADIMADCYEPCTYMAIRKDGKLGDLIKVAYGTKVSDLVGETDAKAIAIGTKLYDTSALDLVIENDTQIGNGVITLFDSKCCILHELVDRLEIQRRQSCGKCTFCREGMIQCHTILKEITQGQGKKDSIPMMTEIGEAMVFSTPCSMGQTGADMVLGSIKYFESEYTDHIKKKKCANGVCKAFMAIYIDPNTCTGCEECADVCPAEAIEGKSGYIHMIDEFECTKCGKCIEVCDEDAIIQTEGRVPKLPTRLTKVGKFKKRH